MKYCFLRYPDGKSKALTLSYDDGNRNDIKLIEIADKYGIKATLNINNFALYENDSWHLSIEELKQLTAKGGHEIAVHGARHMAPGLVTYAHGINDILTNRKSLENALGRIIRGMAYPDSGITRIAGGKDKNEIKSYIKSLGIAYARSLNGDNDLFNLPEDFYEWIPTAHHTNPEVMNYLDKFLSAKLGEYCASRSPMLFYLWGHSFEFANNNNWELFEEFCQKAGGKDDIWYASNIEICDYVTAFNSLIFNVDATLVFNPTHRTVWFEADGKILSVKSGETLTL